MKKAQYLFSFYNPFERNRKNVDKENLKRFPPFIQYNTPVFMEERNLNIHDYSFTEVLNLFGLTRDISEEEIVQARRKTLMTHPDKSRMPPEYFTFYKQAYEMVLKYYRETQKTQQVVPMTNPDYEAPDDINPSSFVAPKPTEQFTAQFNQVFEKETANQERTEKHKERFGWFSTEEKTDLENQPVVKSAKDIHHALDEMRKRNTQPQSMMVYREARPLTTGRSAGNYYEDVEDTAETEYIASDTFSQLKYDDIRRVHKDQTILPTVEVRERPATLEQYSRQRDDVSALNPMEKQRADALLEQEKKASLQQWNNRYERSQQMVQQYETKSKNILSSFLRLKE